MRKLFLAFIGLALALLIPLYGMAEGEGILTFEDNTPYLFGEIRPLMSASQVSDFLSEAGYNRTQNSIYAFLPNQWVFQATSKEPYLVVLIVDEETDHITNISLMYSASGDTFSKLFETIETACGEGATQNSTGYEQIRWIIGDYRLSITGNAVEASNAKNISLFDLQRGKYPFYLVISSSNDRVVAEEVMSDSGKVPFPSLRNDIQFGDSRADVRSKETMSMLMGLDASWDHFGRDYLEGIANSEADYHFTECFYDELINVGKISPSDYYWTLYGVSSVYQVKIAITKYHLESGETVTIPENQWNWETWTKN